ncbi:MAG: GNAT family N-acetyltransferase [Hyphomicrobiales bacterium]
MTIRPMQPGDIPALIELFAEHAAYEKLPFRGHGREAALTELIFGETPRIFGWVAEGDGGLAGYMTATIDYATWSAAPFVYMDCLYLKPEARGGGTGRRFMDILRAFARARSCGEIQWQTPPDNDLGIGFYRKIGARELAKARFSLAAEETA